jgi:restriction system protein
MSAVAEMSWQDFELLIGEAFRLQGFTVVERGGAGPDGGIDLLLKRDGEKFLVQCKHWRSLKVGVSVAREMFGLIAAEGASGAFIVTGGEFTAEAKAFAQGRNLQLIDGKKLSGLLQQAKTNKRASSAPKPPASKPAQAGSAEAPPSCSTCQATMVRRTAKKGQNAGAQFWGCTRYPACRGTR